METLTSSASSERRGRVAPGAPRRHPDPTPLSNLAKAFRTAFICLLLRVLPAQRLRNAPHLSAHRDRPDRTELVLGERLRVCGMAQPHAGLLKAPKRFFGNLVVAGLHFVSLESALVLLHGAGQDGRSHQLSGTIAWSWRRWASAAEGGVGCRDRREVEGTCGERSNKLQPFPLYTTLSNRARGSGRIELFSALLSYSTMSATDVSDRPRTYRPKDIADATGRHPESIRHNLRDGDIEGHKMGGE